MGSSDMLRRINAPVELGRLMATSIGSVVQAQEQLDAYSQRRAQEFHEAEPGSVVLPPLWYTFSAVDLELELAATVGAPPGDDRPVLLAKTLTPTSVGLYGYAASAGLRVRLRIEPQGMAMITPARSEPTAIAERATEDEHG